MEKMNKLKEENTELRDSVKESMENQTQAKDHYVGNLYKSNRFIETTARVV